MSLRHRQLKRNRYYHERNFFYLCFDPACKKCNSRESAEPWEGPDQCWCGEENAYFAPVGGTCAGTGMLTCYCGGDLCVCHNHGEVECLGCEDCEAWQFAMELLMPEEIVRREYAKFGPIDLMDTKRLKKFADKFRVDPQVMAIRLGQLSKSSLCIWCGAPFDVKDMRVITRRDDPYIQMDESEADYIPEHNRIHCCQECYKDTYEPS